MLLVMLCIIYTTIPKLGFFFVSGILFIPWFLVYRVVFIAVES